MRREGERRWTRGRVNIYTYEWVMLRSRGSLTVIASISELCNCATRSHFALYVCMYLCQSRLGPRAYQVTSYASAARMSRGYMVCARVAWLHSLRPCACRVVTWFARWIATAARSWRDFVSQDTRTTCQYLDRVKMNVAQYRVCPDPRASTL